MRCTRQALNTVSSWRASCGCFRRCRRDLPAAPWHRNSSLNPNPNPHPNPNPTTTHEPAELDATEALAQLFQLRLEGWRKFHALAIKDLLNTSDLARLPLAGGGAWALQLRRPPATARFHIVSTLLPPSNAGGGGCARCPGFPHPMWTLQQLDCFPQTGLQQFQALNL